MSGTNYIASNWRTPENSNSSKNDNYSLSFDGSSYIDCGNISALNGTTEATWSGWFNRGGTGTYYFMSTYGTTSSTIQFGVYSSATGITVLMGDSVGTQKTMFNNSSLTLTTGTWYHLAFVYDEAEFSNANKMKVYVDGVPQTNAAAGAALTTLNSSTANFEIGKLGGYTTNEFNGDISDVAIFNYALSDVQIKSLAGSTKTGAGNPMALKPTPVGYWPLGDNSASDPLAQPNVAVEDASVFDFDGSNDKITFSDITSSGDFTVSFWAKPTAFNTNGSSFVFGTESGNSNFFKFLSATRVQMKIVSSNGGTNTFTDTTGSNNVVLDEWQNFIATRDSSGNFIMYRNGVQFGSTLTNANTLTINSIGRVISSSIGYAGGISNFATWNSVQNVTSIYNSGVPGDLSSLNPTVWWKLDESANWEADTVGAWQIPDAVSEFPQSFNFDGSNDLINCGNSIFNSETALSISAWVKPTSYGGAAAESFVSTDAASPRGFYLSLYNGTNFRFAFTTNGTNLTAINTVGGTVDLNVWQHILVTWDQVNLKLYKNGLLLNTVPTTFASNGTFTTTNDLLIGVRQSPNVGSFPGKISNVQIWDVALDQPKVTTLYNGGTPTLTPPNQSDLKAWYKLDDTSNWINYPQNSSFTPDYWSINPANQTIGATEALNFSGGYQNLPGTYEGLDFNDTPLTDNKFILSWWWNSTKPGGDAGYIYFQNAASQSLSFYVYNGAFMIYMNPTTTGTDYWRGIIPVAETGWSHMAVYMDQGSGTTWDASDTNNLKVFVNGSEISNSSGGGTLTNASVRTIANQLMMTTGGNFEGYQWSNFALLTGTNAVTSTIPTLYNGGTPGDISSLNPTWWYKLNSSDTSFPTSTPPTSADNVFTVTDSSGNGNTTTGPFYYALSLTTPSQVASIQTIDVVSNQGISSGMTEQSLVNNNVSTLNGESSGMTSGNLVLSDLTRNLPYENYSLQFDGTSDNLYIGTGLNLGTNSTVSLWIKRGRASGTEVVLSEDSYTSNYLFEIGPAQLWYRIDSVYLTFQSAAISAIINNNTTNWTHICFVRSGDSVELFLNGNSMQVLTGVGSVIDTRFDRIGAWYNATYAFQGNIGEVSAFNNALSGTEVQNLYANGMPQDLTTFTPQPVSWWTLGKESFWDGSDWVIRDMIGTNDGLSDNMGGSELKGDAPRSEANGVGTNIAVPTDLKGNAGWSDKNGYSINMSSTARTTDTP